MKNRRRHLAEQTITKLHDTNAMLVAGKNEGEVLHALEVSARRTYSDFPRILPAPGIS